MGNRPTRTPIWNGSFKPWSLPDIRAWHSHKSPGAEIQAPTSTRVPALPARGRRERANEQRELQICRVRFLFPVDFVVTRETVPGCLPGRASPHPTLPWEMRHATVHLRERFWARSNISWKHRSPHLLRVSWNHRPFHLMRAPSTFPTDPKCQQDALRRAFPTDRRSRRSPSFTQFEPVTRQPDLIPARTATHDWQCAAPTA